MLNVIKSDFYKILRMKSFYICGLIAGVLSLLLVIANDVEIKADMGIDASVMRSLLGLNGISAITMGTNSAGILIAILLSIFISSEFSFGTMKNIAPRGISRANIYLSKMVIGVFAVIVYTLICAAAAFVTGNILWGTGELTRAVFLDIAKMLSLYMLAEFAMQCLFIMIGFLIRNTGGAVAINLSMLMLVPQIVLRFVDYAMQNWFNFIDFSIFKYWPTTYCSTFLSMKIPQDAINIGLIVCASYIIVSTFIGMFTFQKRDIK